MTHASAAEIRAILDDLIRQRRRMSASAEPGLLEANRLSIAYWQWQLSRARATPGSAGTAASGSRTPQ
jgi:hypothetical protein